MLKNYIVQLYFFLSYLMGFGQSAKYKDVAFLPEVLKECSGMIYYPPNRLIYINDSGNNPEIFATDTLGNLVQQYCLPGAVNIDWEDLARDRKGNIYIADFGNNLNRRKDLVIYKANTEKLLNGDDSFKLEEIRFSYEDQQGFPPERENRRFDMEALIHAGDSLYLFSKNRTSPFNGYTYCYRLPDTPGTFVAEKTDSFQTGLGLMESHWIAGADYREDPKTLLLLGYDKLWIFYYFEGTRFFRGKHSVLYFNNFSQKESVTFFKNNRVLFTDEKNKKTDGKLYQLELPDIPGEGPFRQRDSEIARDSVSTGGREFQDEISISFYCHQSCSPSWEVFNDQGQKLYTGQFKEAESSRKNRFVVNTQTWESGNYTLNVILNGSHHIFELKKTPAPGRK